MRSQKHQQVDPALGDNPIRLIDRHFPSLIPSTSARQNPQRKCVVCAKTTTRPKKGLIPDTNALNVMSDFVFPVVFKIIIL